MYYLGLFLVLSPFIAMPFVMWWMFGIRGLKATMVVYPVCALIAAVIYIGAYLMGYR